MTAKATHLGQNTIASKLVGAVGTVPLMRHKDAPVVGSPVVDNSKVLLKLSEVTQKNID